MVDTPTNLPNYKAVKVIMHHIDDRVSPLQELIKIYRYEGWHGKKQTSESGEEYTSSLHELLSTIIYIAALIF